MSATAHSKATARPLGYVYIRSEPGLWTVGFYRPDGKWEPESDHDSTSKAADRVNFLMGGNPSNHDRLKRVEKLARKLSQAVLGWEPSEAMAKDFVNCGLHPKARELQAEFDKEEEGE